jgi:hypothetical protein
LSGLAIECREKNAVKVPFVEAAEARIARSHGAKRVELRLPSRDEDASLVVARAR